MMFFQAEDGIRDIGVTGVQTCALPIFKSEAKANPNRNDIAAHWGQNGYKEADRKQQVSERRWREGKTPALLVAVESRAATRPSGVEQPPKFKNPCPI